MAIENPTVVALGLIERHGLRAAAVAQEQLEEARLAGDTAAFEHWSAVALATADLRRTGRLRTQPTKH